MSEGRIWPTVTAKNTAPRGRMEKSSHQNPNVKVTMSPATSATMITMSHGLTRLATTRRHGGRRTTDCGAASPGASSGLVSSSTRWAKNSDARVRSCSAVGGFCSTDAPAPEPAPAVWPAPAGEARPCPAGELACSCACRSFRFAPDARCRMPARMPSASRVRT
ncbi:hypothetical protein ACFPRL_23865 [Pseudoclavibacter helvolus]